MSRTDVDRYVVQSGTGTTKQWDAYGNLASDVTWNGEVSTLREIRRGSVTPDFRKRLQDRSLPTNNFYYYKRVRSNSYGSYVWDVPNVGRSESVGLISLSSNFGFQRVLPVGDVDSDAVYKILSKLKDRDVDLSVAFGERKQTAALFTDVFNRVLGSFTALSSGNKIQAAAILAGYDPTRTLNIVSGGSLASLSSATRARRAKKASNYARLQRQLYLKDPQLGSLNQLVAGGKVGASNWLAWKYGITPLMLDLQGSAAAIAKAMSDTPPRGRVSASKTVDYSLREDMSANWGIPTLVKEWGSYTCKYVLYFSQDGILPTMTALGLTNPAATLWELATLSFVGDWFYDIGAYLDALDAHIGLSFQDGCKTTFLRQTRTYNGVGGMSRAYLYGQPDGFTTGNVKARDFLVECKRDHLPTFPSASLPRLGANIGRERGASLASLVVQRLKKVKV